MFAASLPFPSHCLPGSILATAVRNALLSQSWAAHCQDYYAPRPADSAAPLKNEDTPAELVVTPRPELTPKQIRTRIYNQRAREKARRLRRQNVAHPPVMTGEELVLAVLEVLDSAQAEQAKEWQVAARVALPWVDVDGSPAVSWGPLAALLGEEEVRGMCEAFHRLRSLAGLPDIPSGKVPQYLIPLVELVAMVACSRTFEARRLRRMMKPDPLKL